jgi:chloride channel protein, CIC family
MFVGVITAVIVASIRRSAGELAKEGLFDISPTLAVAAGAAAGMAAGTRLLITSVLFAALLVGTAGIDATPAAVLAAAAAWLTMQGVDRRAA